MGQASIDDIVVNHGPVADTSASASTAAPAGGTASLNDIVTNHGPAPAAPPAPGTTGVTGALNKFGEFGAGVGEGAISSMGETIQSLPWVGKKILSPQAMQAEREYFKPGSAAEKYGQTTGDIAEPILEFVLGDEALKGVALAEKLGVASKIAKIAQDSPYIGKLLQHGVNAARMGTVGTAEALAKGATPSTAVKTGAVTGVGGEAASAAIDAAPGAVQAVKDAVAPSAPNAESLGTRLTNPFKKLLTTPQEAGAAATQEPAATAVRTAVGAPAGAPIIEGATSVADDLLSKVGVQKDVAYKQIDDAVGFDLKAEKKALSDARYELRQPGVDKVKIQKEIDDSVQRIADANKILVERGINPKDADNLNTAWEATKIVKNDIVKSTASDGTINVKQLLSRAKNARFNPRYGDRLAQAFGKGDAAAGKAIADKYIAGLEDAQKAGVDALRAQRFKLWLTGLVGASVIGAGGVKGVEALLAP